MLSCKAEYSSINFRQAGTDSTAYSAQKKNINDSGSDCLHNFHSYIQEVSMHGTPVLIPTICSSELLGN